MNAIIEPTDEYQKLDLRQVQLDTLIGLILVGILAIAWFVASLIQFFVMGFSISTNITLIAGLVIIPSFFWLSIYWPKLSHRKTSWRLDENGLEIRRGVIWRHRISLPTARVQHADVSQGPLQRQYELGTLTVHTAGTQNASIELEGLAHGIAIQLRDRIVRQRKAVDVV